MSHEPPTPHTSMLVVSPEQQIPPLSGEQYEGLLWWSLMSLPHRVETLGTGDAVIHLSSGRAARVTPTVQDDGAVVHMAVTVHEIEDRDVPEMMAVHGVVINITLLAAMVLWGRQRAGA
jgi:hypothetical protein